MDPQAKSKVETYCQAWSGSLALLLSRIAPGEWRAEANAEAVPDGNTAIARVRITAEGGLEGGQSFNFAAADVAALLGIFLGEEASLAGELDAAQNEALEELIRQWAGLAASALKPDFGEVTLQVALESPEQAASGVVRMLRASDGARSIAAAMDLDEALVSALKQIGARTRPEANARTEAASAAISLSPPNQASPRIEELLREGNLELLMDVELAVMLRFGSRQATLREVLDLATGAVLELDREIQEPVDLVLHGKVIARGEVVVVDGNYGVRVIEVASPQQRVNSL
jgi:flagellar motor switch protein FliN/FliY